MVKGIRLTPFLAPKRTRTVELGGRGGVANPHQRPSYIIYIIKWKTVRSNVKAIIRVFPNEYQVARQLDDFC